jgi:hypothetical protein
MKVNNMDQIPPDQSHLKEINFNCEWFRMIIKDWRRILRQKGFTIRLTKKRMKNGKECREYEIEVFESNKAHEFRKKMRKVKAKYPILKGEFGFLHYISICESGEIYCELGLGLSILHYERNAGETSTLFDMIQQVLCLFHDYIGF